MNISPAPLDGLWIIETVRHEDDRGFFSETWNRRSLQMAGIDIEFVQDNHSLSRHAGTIRGLHYQSPPHAQAKLVRCTRGRIFDAVVDIRRSSPTFGQWFGIELGGANGLQLLLSEGFLHGFLTLEPDCEVLYKCSDFYAPACDGAVRWDSCGINWPEIAEGPYLSDKDSMAPALSEFHSPFD